MDKNKYGFKMFMREFVNKKQIAQILMMNNTI